MIPVDNDVTKPDEIQAEPAGATDEVADPCHTAAPAIVDPDEHEEAGYGHGV